MNFGGGTAVVMFVAAAVHGATPEQRARLKAEVGDDLLKAWCASGDAEDLRVALQRAVEIRGPGWTIPNEYAVWINAAVSKS